MQVKDSTALVTGGASGLGAAVVIALKAAGAKVASFDLAESANADLSLKVDVTDAAAVEAAVAQVTVQLGAIHFVINCAGFGMTSPILSPEGTRQDNTAIDLLVDVNLKGTWNVTRSAVAAMQHNGPDAGGSRGVVVNTASIAAHEGPGGMAAYAASKAGVIGLTVPLASDLAQHGFRVVAIAPGLFDTPLLSNLPEGALEMLARNTIFPRCAGSGDEFARLVQHVIENDYINATTIHIHAGARAPLPA